LNSNLEFELEWGFSGGKNPIATCDRIGGAATRDRRSTGSEDRRTLRQTKFEV
jgi:hypothetical protein